MTTPVKSAHRTLCLLLAALLASACSPDPEPAREAADPPLISAAEQGNLALLDQLLGSRTPVDTRDQCRWTPLMKAALNGHVEAARRLLDAGADPRAADKGGYTALMLAASNNHAAVVRLLAQRGAELDHAEPALAWTALIWAAKRGHDEAVEALLNAGADSSRRDTAGASAADWAERNGHTRTLALLRPTG